MVRIYLHTYTVEKRENSHNKSNKLFFNFKILHNIVLFCSWGCYRITWAPALICYKIVVNWRAIAGIFYIGPVLLVTKKGQVWQEKKRLFLAKWQGNFGEFCYLQAIFLT